MTNEEEKCLNKAIVDYQREMFDKGGFYQSEMAQYLMQLSFEKCAEWKDQQARESFCLAVCKGRPPRSTCTSLGTCDDYDRFSKLMRGV